MSKPRLIFVNVPWMISPSTPFLRLSWSEEDSATHVDFVAYYETYGRQIRVPDGDIQVVNAPSEFVARSDNAEVPYRLVRVTFTAVSHLRVLPAISSWQVIDEDDYDWRYAKFTYVEGSSIDDYLQRTAEEWLRSGICPNARMYVVEKSPWIRELGSEYYGASHFLLLGHDAYVEIIADKWEWQEGQALPGW